MLAIRHAVVIGWFGQHLSQVLSNPRGYLDGVWFEEGVAQTWTGDFLANTCTGVYAPNNKGHDARTKLAHIRQSIYSQLDRRWKEAYDESYE